MPAVEMEKIAMGRKRSPAHRRRQRFYRHCLKNLLVPREDTCVWRQNGQVRQIIFYVS